MEEFADELLGVGPEMTAWAEDDGTANEKIKLLTDNIFWTAGCHEAAEAMKKEREGL